MAAFAYGRIRSAHKADDTRTPAPAVTLSLTAADRSALRSQIDEHSNCERFYFRLLLECLHEHCSCDIQRAVRVPSRSTITSLGGSSPAVGDAAVESDLHDGESPGDLGGWALTSAVGEAIVNALENAWPAATPCTKCPCGRSCAGARATPWSHSHARHRSSPRSSR